MFFASVLKSSSFFVYFSNSCTISSGLNFSIVFECFSILRAR